MFYQFTTGCSVSFCMMKLSDEKQATAAIQTLSRFTLFGLGLNPEKYDPEKFPAWRQPSLYAGWKPSPSSDLKSRVFRPPMTASPEILASLIAEKWVQFQDLPPVDPAKKGSYFDILHAFYKKFHQYDVVGITTVRKHENPPNGWCCKIQFGSPEEAKAALNSHVEAGVFLGRPAKAKIHRGGPNVHRELWAYRQSLPKDTPLKDVGALLEQKYREVIIEGRPSRQRSKYPTPESAVALKLALG
ncbi:uncharacterized protein EKO05_0007288 [Ascochyta rabiei]|uniref:Uncharacterized protein n=1 Tax=Didymella rabiei TaxID=5454 RepID=A0A163BVQ6_DIDRA|nr:uncharacterized protein EKO05_0007288 [Ascochyta rabiei]KZM22035.1 hypothetical protein ST47_g6839 [Ascochyta rabiei]UPX16907.1 hypothetical protein EKO05_0007288 [Ascochyta rabiei]